MKRCKLCKFEAFKLTQSLLQPVAPRISFRPRPAYSNLENESTLGLTVSFEGKNDGRNVKCKMDPCICLCSLDCSKVDAFDVPVRRPAEAGALPWQFC